MPELYSQQVHQAEGNRPDNPFIALR